MSTTHGNVDQVLSNPSVDMALTKTAQMFGLPKATVTQIVQVCLPLMARMAEGDAEILRRLHTMTMVAMPAPAHDFYTCMATSTDVRQAIMDDYRATFGALFDTVNRAAARRAGTTDGQARDVIAAVLPAVTREMGLANASGTDRGFLECLRALQPT